MEYAKLMQRVCEYIHENSQGVENFELCNHFFEWDWMELASQVKVEDFATEEEAEEELSEAKVLLLIQSAGAFLFEEEVFL